MRLKSWYETFNIKNNNLVFICPYFDVWDRELTVESGKMSEKYKSTQLTSYTLSYKVVPKRTLSGTLDTDRNFGPSPPLLVLLLHLCIRTVYFYSFIIMTILTILSLCLWSYLHILYILDFTLSEMISLIWNRWYPYLNTRRFTHVTFYKYLYI